MANPLKILTVLTASQAAQFKEAVELSGAVTARDGVTVSAGNVEVSAGNLSVVGNMSGSGTLQAGGAATVAGVLTAQSASQFDSRITRGDDLRADMVLGTLNPTAEVALSGTTLATSLIAYTVNGISTNASTFRAYDAMNATKFYVSGTSGNVSGSGTAQFAGAATLGSTLGVAGVATFSSDVSASANLKVAGDLQVDGDVDFNAALTASALKVENAADVDGALDVGGVASFAADITASAGLELAGAADLNGALDVQGNANFQAQLTASSMSVTNALAVGGNLSVQGNLQVLGTIDAINRTDLYVEDKVILVASGAADASAANGAGLEVDGADASIKYASSGDRWLANKDMEVSAAYYAGGEKLLEKASMGAAVGAKLSYSDYGYVGVADFTYGDGVLIGGKAAVGIETPNLTVVATSSFQRDATFQAQVAMDAALKLSGSAFTYIATPIVSDKYDVDAAIHALDAAVSASANAGTNFKADYNARRYVTSGSLSSGTVTISLSTAGGAEFAVGEISKIALDVMIDENNDGHYRNDLVAIEMWADGAELKVKIDAPATPSASYRLIAVNEENIA